MSYCLNSHCPQPENAADAKFCLSCGSKLLLKDRYRAIKPIGQGGFGKTFLAVDEDKPSKPPCVIKQFYPQAQGTNTLQKAVELFTQEAVQLDDLGQHPQIPALLAYFTQDDRQYLVQEFINGQNLAQELAQNGAFSESQIWQLLQDLLPVLQFCHSRGVIHRDIKPENILRDSNAKLVLVDFGASKSATGTALNQTGTSIGTPEYVAPEQMRGRALFASDIYSLGATCVHLLTARSPFDSYNINNDTWIWQKFLQTPLSSGLNRILEKMLVSIPMRRYQTADEVLKDLNQSPVVATPATTAKPKSTPTSVSKSSSKPDLELEEVKTQILGTAKPQPNQPQPPKPISPPQPPKLISPPANNTSEDKDLEELKAKFMGNNKSPNQ
ncbi:serine/threonine-protein kinase [Nodularia spumigena CS-584]|uniref:serine/threonine-protein kinase n=1 Tax=Nodularia spumigena TaxID=70799 RepID=UPI0000EA8CFA|nr:serine/threonine-protein kinase [Nodularia spumigena]AHJ27920.1 serine/threonine kinase [Nodularia spumigena CCY9414]EAW44267.1 serine/threonine kinase [Nodularia spumigena CCY9414]MDB9381409.1 serine/threonine-protein kinase [Nodularia spumigena CS-584]